MPEPLAVSCFKGRMHSKLLVVHQLHSITLQQLLANFFTDTLSIFSLIDWERRLIATKAYWVLRSKLHSKSLWMSTRHWQFLEALSLFFSSKFTYYIWYRLMMRSHYQLGSVFFIYQTHPFQSREWEFIFTYLQTNDCHSGRNTCQYQEYCVLSHTYKFLLVTVFVLILTILYKLFCFKIQAFSFLSACPHMLCK